MLLSANSLSYGFTRPWTLRDSEFLGKPGELRLILCYTLFQL